MFRDEESEAAACEAARAASAALATMGRLKIDGEDGGVGAAGSGAAGNGDARSIRAWDLEWRRAMTRAIAESGKSRAAIAAEMTALLEDGRPVTKALLDAWTAPSRTGWRMPASYVPAFVRAAGAQGLIEALARACGRMAITQEEAALAALGRATIERHRAPRRRGA